MLQLHRYIISFILVLLAVPSAIASVVIYGNAPTYAGKTLAVYEYSEQIMYEQEELGQATVGSNGDFKFTLDIQQTQQVFIPMPTCRGFIYVEPGKSYEISLPDYAERTIEDKLNPYFAPKDFLLNIVGLKKGDFNYQMMEFEDGFDFYSMKHITYGAKTDSVKKSIGQMRQIFADLKTPYQKRFKEYRYLLLENLAAKTVPLQDSVIHKLNQLGVDYENPAFWEAFNNIFDDFIYRNEDTEEYEVFKRIVNVGDGKMLMAMLKSRYGITNQLLRELAAIRITGDLVMHADFDRSKVIALMLGMTGNITDKGNRDLLKARVNKLCVNYIGTTAPDFDGKTTDGKVVRLSDFKGKYVYLNFCNTNIEKCQRDLQVLQRFVESYEGNLVVINIYLYDEGNTEKIKMMERPYKGKMYFVTPANSDALRQTYDVRAIPGYLLIDKQGNFMMTKGTEPNDELRIFLQNAIK